MGQNSRSWRRICAELRRTLRPRSGQVQNPMSQVKEVPVPVTCNLFHGLKAVHFCDAFQAPVTNPELGLKEACRAVFACAPAWVDMLLKMRGVVATMLGLRHGAEAGFEVSPDARYEIGQRVGRFLIRSIERNELIVGENDKHLDFRISIYRSSLNGVETVTVSTAVEIHNIIGRIYMLVVEPFHRYIARTMLQRAVNAGRL
jgi:hypothetical protein